MKTKLNNIERVTHIMNFGSPMKQLVVMAAIEAYAKQIAAMDDAPDNWPTMLSWDAWKDSCESIVAEMTEHANQ